MCSHKFTVDDLRSRYGCKTDSELAGLLDLTKGTVSLWRSNGVPSGYQKILNIETTTSVSRKKPTTSTKATT